MVTARSGVEDMAGPHRIGLFGGTFDPIHKGHLAAADSVTKVLQLDALWFIPAAAPPHKDTHRDSLDITPFADRAEMIRRAIGERKDFHLSAVEDELPAPSYTIDTLRELRKRLGADVKLFFLIGVDAFIEISTWKDYRELPKYANFVVVARPCCQISEIEEVMRQSYDNYRYDPAHNTWHAEGAYKDVCFLAMKPVNVSSSEIRKMVARGLPVADFVPDAVAEYIKEKKLYREEGRNI
jgi:nicotinate-nucleotide adenylyltransferase